MKIIKRSGEEKTFDSTKIVAAIKKANETVLDAEKINDAEIQKIADDIDSIIGCVQLIVRQNDSILNYQQDQLRIDSVNNHELRGIRRELIKSNKRKNK